MGKLVKRASVAICSLMLALSMAACGQTGDPSKDSETPAAAQSESVAESEPEVETESEALETTQSDEGNTSAPVDDTSSDYDNMDLNSEGKFDTIEDFLNSSIMQAQIKTQQEALKDSGMSVALRADGNSLIYDFTVEDDTVAQTLTEEYLSSYMESQTETFTGIRESITTAVTVENPVVVVNYLDKEGNVIYSHEYK